MGSCVCVHACGGARVALATHSTLRRHALCARRVGFRPTAFEAESRESGVCWTTGWVRNTFPGASRSALTLPFPRLHNVLSVGVGASTGRRINLAAWQSVPRAFWAGCHLIDNNNNTRAATPENQTLRISMLMTPRVSLASLHPTTCNLNPTPYTLHPKPYTLHHTPYNLNPKP